MWLIILSISFIYIYAFIYSMILRTSPKCKVLNNVRAWNAITILDRTIEWVAWVIPIIYVFWPPNRTWYGALVNQSRRPSQLK